MRPLWPLFAFALPWVSSAADPPAREPLVGVWKLVSYEMRAPSGEVSYPLGKDPAGQIMYDAEGHVSSQGMRRGLPSFASARAQDAANGDIVSAWRGYIGYWGTYAVDEKAGAITHHIEGCWFPNWVGTDQVRYFQLQGDQLTLEANQPGGRSKAVWQRSR